MSSTYNVHFIRRSACRACKDERGKPPKMTCPFRREARQAYQPPAIVFRSYMLAPEAGVAEAAAASDAEAASEAEAAALEAASAASEAAALAEAAAEFASVEAAEAAAASLAAPEAAVSSFLPQAPSASAPAIIATRRVLFIISPFMVKGKQQREVKRLCVSVPPGTRPSIPRVKHLTRRSSRKL